MYLLDTFDDNNVRTCTDLSAFSTNNGYGFEQGLVIMLLDLSCRVSAQLNSTPQREPDDPGGVLSEPPHQMGDGKAVPSGLAALPLCLH